MAGPRKVGGGKIGEEIGGRDREFSIPKVNERPPVGTATPVDYARAYAGLAELAAESLRLGFGWPYSYAVPESFLASMRLSPKQPDVTAPEKIELFNPKELQEYGRIDDVEPAETQIMQLKLLQAALESLQNLTPELRREWIKAAQDYYLFLTSREGSHQPSAGIEILMRLEQRYWTDAMWADALYLLDWGHQHAEPTNVAIIATRINPERWFEGPVLALRSADRVGAQLFSAVANVVRNGTPTPENIGWYFTDPVAKPAKEASFVTMIDLVLPEIKVDLRLFFARNPEVAIQAQEAFYFNPDKVSVAHIIYFLTLLECIPQSLWTAQTKALVPLYLEPEHNDQPVRDAAIRLLLAVDLPE